MKSKKTLLLAGASLVAGLSGIQAAHAGGHLFRQAPDRGLAITSPLECPDPCDSPVGGCYLYTPYYPGYAPDRRCLLIYGQRPMQYATPAPGTGPANYGAFTGASRDEATLLRLGGNGAGRPGTYRPYPGSGDVIDRIHGR